MQQYADATDATIIAVDWGFAGLSCSNYFELVFCVIDKLVDLSVHWLTKCGVRIGTLDLYGHSLGSQIIGYIAQRLNAAGQLPRALFAFDPAGIAFGPTYRCQGVQNGVAKYVAVYHFNPGEVGTDNLNIGDAIFLVNSQCAYLQPNCTFIDPFCSHTYAREFFLKLTQNVTITAKHISSSPTADDCSNGIVTIYEDMPEGIYYVNTYGSEHCRIGQHFGQIITKKVAERIL